MPFLPVSKIKVNVTTLPQCRLPVKRRGSLPLEQHLMKSELPDISRYSRHGLFHLPRFALDSEYCGRPYGHQAIIRKECLRNAAATPMEILRLTCRAIDLHRELAQKGSVMVLSDVGTGVVFCWSALYGAWLNVKVNTKSMADRAYADAMNAEADQLVDTYWKIADQVYETVMGRYS